MKRVRSESSVVRVPGEVKESLKSYSESHWYTSQSAVIPWQLECTKLQKFKRTLFYVRFPNIQKIEISWQDLLAGICQGIQNLQDLPRS